MDEQRGRRITPGRA